MQKEHSFWDGVSHQELVTLFTPYKEAQFRDRTIRLLEALMPIATLYRDHGIRELSMRELTNMFSLEEAESLAWQSPASLLRYPSAKKDIERLQRFLIRLPGYEPSRIGWQSQTAFRQFRSLSLNLYF